MLLVTYKNFLPLESNNRMLAYYNFLESKGENPMFCFIKGTKMAGPYRHKTFHSFLTGIPFVGIAFGLLRALIHFAISKRTHDMVYLYSPSALWWPLYWIWQKKGYKIIVERTELDSIRQPLNWRDKLLLKLFNWDEKRNEFPSVLISKRLMEHYNKSIFKNFHLPAFIDSAFFEKEPKYDQKYQIGYFGTFGAKDNVEGIIHAFLEAKKSLPQLKLKLMGNAPSDFRHHYANHLALGISFEREIHYSELNTHLQSCDLLISNRDDSEYSQYGFPTKLIEYLASGIPVISTKTSDIEHYFDHEKDLYFIEANNSLALEESIKLCYQKRDAFNQIAQNGRQKVFLSHSQSLLTNWWNFISQQPNQLTT